MKLIDKFEGSGTLISKNDSSAVTYHLMMYQHEKPGGLKDVRGWVRPVGKLFAERGLLLEMGEGYKLKFSFADPTGTVAFHEWIVAP